nr:ComEA family DNA-binding protein [Enterovibrio nigricans]
MYNSTRNVNHESISFCSICRCRTRLFAYQFRVCRRSSDSGKYQHADAEELDKYLDGVGKSKAQAIVDYRTENGAFESADSLSDVKGIGSAIVEKNRDRITL